MQAKNLNLITQNIRVIPDYPKKGIMFRDITPLLKNPKAFSLCILELAKQSRKYNPKYVAGVEARGFIFGSALAHELGIGFIPIRKKGKLPYKTVSVEYALEYGNAEVEMHRDAIKKNDKILLVDDLLATGGTALAAAKLIEKLGGKVSKFIFVIELKDLKGRDRLKKYKVSSLIKYLSEKHSDEEILVKKKLDKIDSGIRERKRKVLSAKEALGAHLKYVK